MATRTTAFFDAWIREDPKAIGSVEAAQALARLGRIHTTADIMEVARITYLWFRGILCWKDYEARFAALVDKADQIRVSEAEAFTQMAHNLILNHDPDDVA
jgi:hypothetical protein